VINFGRVITAMVTPFDTNGNVNYAVVEKLAEYLAANGSDSIVVCGTTGESPTLTWEEEYELFKVVKSAVNGKAKVIAGTGSNSTSEAIEATQHAAKLGLDGSLQVVPYYNKPPQSGLYHHYEAIAKSCPDLPILLYNVPSRTSQNLLPETVAKLAEISNIVAIKEASGNIDIASQIRATTPPEFTIYSGDDSLTLPLLAVGAKGVVSIASHLVGNRIQEMIQAFEAGQNQLATQIHIELFPLFKVLFCTTNPIPLKAALKMQGWELGAPRLPLTELPENLKQEVESIMQQTSLIK
jgi:4-hydroxy-tetrahydrodipicolinate synthase